MTIPRRPPSPARRVIVVVADGLRPDIIPLLELPTLGRLVRQGAATLAGRTVRPSVTAAAMGSLLTGVAPAVHGLTNSRFRVPRPTGPVDPLPRVLAAAGVRSTAWMARLPWASRGLGASIGRRLGFGSVSFDGETADQILDAARGEIAARREGLLVMHWPDADRAGHESGWPSPAYLRAARWIDRCLDELEGLSGAAQDPDTLLIVLADHGGGGLVRRDHDGAHPLNETIPIVLSGGRVRRTALRSGSSLLDVPATVLYALGVEQPVSYSGRALVEAFVTDAGARSRIRRRRLFVPEPAMPLAAAG